MKARKHALLIGINDYTDGLKSSFGEVLAGCVNDVQGIYRLLSARGFQTRLLLDELANRHGIVTAWEKLIKDVRPGDSVTVYFSGRGSWARDPDWPSRHLTLVPYDSERRKRKRNTDIFDLELDDWVARLTAQSVHVTVILDTSSASGGDRDDRIDRSVAGDQRPQEAMRLGKKPDPMPPEIRQALKSRLQPDGDGTPSKWLPEHGRLATVITAGERATENRSAGVSHGAFTRALVAKLERPEHRDTPWRALPWPEITTQVASELPDQPPRLESFHPGEEPGEEQDQPARATSTESPPSRSHALLIGVNKYPNVPEGFGRSLSGTVNDIQRLHRVLTQHGFEVRILLDDYATRQGILAAMDAIERDARDQEPVVVHYSGHGGRIAGKQWRRTFHTLVPYDSGRGSRAGRELPNRDLFDSEIDLWIRKLNAHTSNVSLFFDSCYSGGASRSVDFSSVEFRNRGLAPDTRSPAQMLRLPDGRPADDANQPDPTPAGPRSVASEERGASGWLPTSDRQAFLLAACAADQLAKETRLPVPEAGGRASCGAFSHALISALSQHAQTPWNDLPWKSISEEVRRQVEEEAPGQQVTAEGLTTSAAASELEKHALVIGINKYVPKGGIRELRTPESDARAVDKVLRTQQGYPPRNVHLLLGPEATKAKIMERFATVREAIQPGSSLLLYFAGHGESKGDARGGFEGFLLPQDARVDDSNSWIEMNLIRHELAQLEDRGCRHLLLVLDCCFAGAFSFTRGRRRQQRLFISQYLRYLKSKAWQVLTSAAYNQLARDVSTGDPAQGPGHSPFADALLRGLAGDADLVGDGVITATELHQYIHLELMGLQSWQTPVLSHFSRDSTGQFLFRHPERPIRPVQDLDLATLPRPWKGLEPYTGQLGEPLFFGRKRAIQELRAVLAGASRGQLLAVVGASGSGKSSLVRAGLWPEMINDPSGWRIAEVPRLGEQPGQQLDAPTVVTRDDDAGREDPPTEQRPRLLFIDQFEELYTNCSDRQARDDFLDTLANRIADGERVLITLRSDFEPRLRSRFERDLVTYRVPELELEEAREIAQRPAEHSALFFGPGLVEKMIEDIRATPWPLPLLSVTLDLLYTRAQKRWQTAEPDRELRLEDLPEGGVTAALRQSASELYAAQGAPHQELLRRVFLRLVSLEGGQRTRRRADLRELELADPDEDQPVVKLLAPWIQGRFLVVDEHTLEPANNALIQEWDQINHDLETTRDLVQLLRDLWRQALAWEQAEPSLRQGFLWHHDPRLPRLRVNGHNIPELNKLEQTFVDASFELRREELELEKARRRRAENQMRSSVASEWATRDPTRAALILLEIETPGQTTASDRIAELYSVARMREVLELGVASSVLRCGQEKLTDAAFSPDGQQIVTAGFDGKARVWNSTGIGQPIVLAAPGAMSLSTKLLSAAFSSDGESILTVSTDDRAHLWKADGSGTPRAFGGSRRPIAKANWSADGKTVLTVSEMSQGGIARLWDVSGPGTPRELKQLGASVWNAAFSTHGSRVVTACEDGDARVWSTGGNSGPIRLRGHGERLLWAVFNRKGSKVVTASSDSTARVWNADGTGEPVVLEGHSQRLLRANFSPDGSKIVTTSLDGTARIWNGSGEPILLDQHENTVIDASFSADGRRILTVTLRGTARLWNADGSEEPLILRGFEHQVVRARFDTLGTRVVTASVDGTARIWPLSHPASPVRLAESAADLPRLSSNPDGTRAVTLAADGTAVISPVGTTGADVVIDDPQDTIQSAAFDPSGQRIVTTASNLARIWNADGLGEPVTLRHHDEVEDAAFSEDGSQVITVIDGVAQSWLIGSTALQAAIRGTTSACLEPDFRVRYLGEEPKIAWKKYARGELAHRRCPRPWSFDPTDPAAAEPFLSQLSPAERARYEKCLLKHRLLKHSGHA